MPRNVIILILTMLATSESYSFEANPSIWPPTQSFVATCDAGDSRRYDYHTNFSGEIVGDEWSENEKWSTSGEHWEVFSYNSGDAFITVLKPDTKAAIVARFPNLIIATDPYEGLGAVGVWVYTINLNLEKIVAIESNAFGSNGVPTDNTATGVKARIVELHCDFQFSSS